VGRREEIQALCSALAGLPPQQRDAIVLREFYGMSYAEVGAALGLSGAAVESLLFRSRRRLQEQLRPLRSALGLLALPVTLRESLAQALPGFGGAGASLGVGAVGAPVAVKVAAATMAVGAAGTMAGLEARHDGPRVHQHTRAKPAVVERQAAPERGPVRISSVARNEARAKMASRRARERTSHPVRLTRPTEIEHSGRGSSMHEGSRERSISIEPEHRGGVEGGGRTVVTGSGEGSGSHSLDGGASGSGSGGSGGGGSSGPGSDGGFGLDGGGDGSGRESGDIGGDGH
jgi:hypothetical protein